MFSSMKNRFGFFQENLSIASSKLQSRYGSQILQFIFSSSKIFFNNIEGLPNVKLDSALNVLIYLFAYYFCVL